MEITANITIMLFIFLIVFVAGGILLQIFLSKREGKWPGLILAAVLLIFTNRVKATKKLHPIVFIGFSAVVGIVAGAAGIL